MIKINKLYTKDHQYFLCLESDGIKISIPLDSIHYNRIATYLNKFNKGSCPYYIEEELEDG